MASAKVPESWWRAACERIHVPLACIAANNRFVWVNSSYERLVGYSLAELRHRTWAAITVDEDVGADQRNVEAVLNGSDLSYTMEKSYRHKRGHVIPVTLTVWRHQSRPPDVVFMIAQAMPEQVSPADLRSIRESLTAEFTAIRQRMEIIERNSLMSRRDEGNHGNQSSINIGDKNSNEMIRWLVWAVLAMVGLIGYIVWVATWDQHEGKAKPPNVPGVNVPDVPE